MTRTIQLPLRNVSCEACAKVIGRLLKKYDSATFDSISPDARTLTLTCQENDLGSIKAKLREYDFLDEGETARRHFSYTLQKIIENRPGFQAENTLLANTIFLFGILFLALGAMGLFGLSPSELFNPLWPILALIPLGIAVNAGALLHVRNLCTHFTCSNGMMTGMIVGMISGFMSGAILGATNGMFVGSVVGMFIGMGASAYAVRKAGVMSILEGLMAGLMAGTMGAMLSVMMATDHLVLFLYLLFAICTLILGGMSYFMFTEVGPILDERKDVALVPLAMIGLLVMALILALIFFGPKSAAAFGGIV